MTSILKSNDNFMSENIILPMPPTEKQARSEMEVYARFMRHLRLVPNSRLEIKVLSAIQFTADMLDISDALVAKMLVDMGLRCSRRALPSEYLDFLDKALLRQGWEVGGASAASTELKAHWDRIGEDKFAAYRGEQVIAEPPMFVET